MSESPWRFLSPLSGESTDRELLSLTRGEELSILTNLIAASRVTLLYSSSGVGKTSLINAGIIPFFSERGYVVLRTRPRPPWSTRGPVEAFRSSSLRDIITPPDTQRNADLLRTAERELAALDNTHAAALKKIFPLLGARVSTLESDTAVIDELKQYIAARNDGDLATFIAHLQAFPGFGQNVSFLVICDQFEELFVHYANSPEIKDFTRQLGDVWADKSLRIQFVFSMREEWVGSMIEFRNSIPEIFGSYFRLQPIRMNVARSVITKPLERAGIRIAEGT